MKTLTKTTTNTKIIVATALLVASSMFAIGGFKYSKSIRAQKQRAAQPITSQVLFEELSKGKQIVLKSIERQIAQVRTLLSSKKIRSVGISKRNELNRVWIDLHKLKRKLIYAKEDSQLSAAIAEYDDAEGIFTNRIGLVKAELELPEKFDTFCRQVNRLSKSLRKSKLGTGVKQLTEIKNACNKENAYLKKLSLADKVDRLPGRISNFYRNNAKEWKGVSSMLATAKFKNNKLAKDTARLMLTLKASTQLLQIRANIATGKLLEPVKGEITRIRSLGSPKVLIMMVHWLNSPYEGSTLDPEEPVPMMNRSELDDLLVRTDEILREYSYNRFHPNFTVCEVDAGVEAPATLEESLAIAVDLCDSQVDYSDIELLVLHRGPSRNAYVGQQGLFDTDEGSIRKHTIYLSGRVLVHEMGHWIGLPHAHKLNSFNVYDREGYEYIMRGNKFDTMGVVKGHYNCAYKEKLNWLNPLEYERGTSTYSLSSFEHNRSGSCLAIPLGEGRPEYCQAIYVEYRRPIDSVDSEFITGRPAILDRDGGLAVYCVAWNEDGGNVGSTILDCTPTDRAASYFYGPAVYLGERCDIANLNLAITYLDREDDSARVYVAKKATVPTADLGGDVTSPWGILSINDDARVTISPDVTLGLSCSDNVECTEMRIKNEGEEWAFSWEPYVESKPWTLVGDDGVKTVYVQYRDAERNTSITIVDTIEMEATPPDTIIDSSPPTIASSNSATFEFHAIGSGTNYVQCKLDDQPEFGSCISPKEYSFLAVGNHTFQARARNSRGLIDLSPASYSWIVNDIPYIHVFHQYDSFPGRVQSAGFTDRDGIIVIHAGINDQSPGGMVKLEVEVQPVGVEFTNIATHATDFVEPNTFVSLIIDDLSNGSYHWQIRAIDSLDFTSDWISFSDNTENEADFIIVQ